MVSTRNFKYNDIGTLKIKGQRKIYCTKTNQSKIGLTDYFNMRSISLKSKDSYHSQGHYIMIKGANHQEDIVILNAPKTELQNK